LAQEKRLEEFKEYRKNIIADNQPFRNIDNIDEQIRKNEGGKSTISLGKLKFSNLDLDGKLNFMGNFW
jgi:hypothetical protein